MSNEPDVERWRRRSAISLSLSPLPVARFIAGWALLSLAVAPFFAFPVIGAWGLVLALSYLGLLYLVPRAWLYILPVATAGLDLSSLTGRTLYNSLDLLVLVTVAGSLMFDRYRASVLRPSIATLCVELLFVWSLIGFTAWHSFFSPPGALTGFPWLEPHFSYHSLKGMLWGILLIPAFGHAMQRNKRGTTRDLILGCALATCALLLAIATEFIGAMNTLAVFAMGGLADYTPTAFLSDARIGPATVDGLALLLAPCLLYAAIHYRDPARLAALALWLALALLLYAGGDFIALAALLAASAAYFGLEAWPRRYHQWPTSIRRALLAGALVWLASSALAQVVNAVAGASIAIAGSAWALRFLGAASRFRDTPQGRLVSAGLLALPLVCMLLTTRVAVHWHQGGPEPGTGPAKAGQRTPRAGALLFGREAELPPPPSGGAADLRIARKPGTSLLLLPPSGASEQRTLLGQRASIGPNRDYGVIMRARADKPAQLEVMLCEAAVRLLPRVASACPSTRISLGAGTGTFSRLEATLNSGPVGAGLPLTRLPTQILLRNNSPEATVEVDSIAVTRGGINLLVNSSFSENLDHWFHFFDGQPVIGRGGNLYEESGLVAAILLLTLLGMSLYSATRPRSEDSLAPVYSVSALGICLLGLAADPLISPRVSWLFYFLLFAGLVQLKVITNPGIAHTTGGAAPA